MSAGVGLGLFGVLSIIRLRSEELSQREVAYYFASLSLGLLGGLSSNIAVTLALMIGIVGAVAGESPFEHPDSTPTPKMNRVLVDNTILR